LKLDNAANPWTTKLDFADAFMFFDTDNRFAYKGTNTIVPCNNNWMRDIAMTIYPIKQKHVDAFRNIQLGRSPFTKFDTEAGTGGNNRQVQPTTPGHEVFVVTNEYSAFTLLLFVLAVVFFLMCTICWICCCCYCCKYRKLKNPSSGKPVTAGKGGKAVLGK
jgi:hypothetical protein